MLSLSIHYLNFHSAEEETEVGYTEDTQRRAQHTGAEWGGNLIPELNLSHH